MKGKFIVFEGIDGSGKTTQTKLLHDSLIANGIECILTFEPTNKNYGKKIRDSFSGERLAPETELEYFTLDREEHISELVVPNLERGIHVISDRYYYSTAAYQGARGVFDYKDILERQMSKFLKPDICFLLDIDIDECSSRIENRGKANSFENADYLKKVSSIFKKIENDSSLNGGLINIDGRGSLESVHKSIFEKVQAMLC